MESSMYTCQFCQRVFPSQQSFYAHCRWCDKYRQHKEKQNTASRTSLRQAVPKARPEPATLSPIPSSPQSHTNDPLAPFRTLLQDMGASLPRVDGIPEAPHQQRRRLLQAGKTRAIDHYWSCTFPVTVEMRAAARLEIDRELRNEP
jgi:hypothetical protein